METNLKNYKYYFGTRYKDLDKVSNFYFNGSCYSVTMFGFISKPNLQDVLEQIEGIGQEGDIFDLYEMDSVGLLTKDFALTNFPLYLHEWGEFKGRTIREILTDYFEERE